MTVRDLATYKRAMANLSLAKLEIVVAHLVCSRDGQGACVLARLGNHLRACVYVEDLR
jgi:hypothetical protein